MSTRYDPAFVRDTRRVRTERDVVAACLQHAHALALLLRKDVAENAAFLLLEVVAPGAEFIKHTAGHKSGRRKLRRRMLEFLARIAAVILENTNVFETLVALEVLDALCS